MSMIVLQIARDVPRGLLVASFYTVFAWEQRGISRGGARVCSIGAFRVEGVGFQEVGLPLRDLTRGAGAHT